VLTQLGNLDPGEDPPCTAGVCDGHPRRGSIVVPAKSAQNARSLNPDSIACPRVCEALTRLERCDEPITDSRSAAEVRSRTRLPPGVIRIWGDDRGPRSAAEWIGRRRRARQCVVEALERLLESSLPGEGSCEPAQVTVRRPLPRRGVGIPIVDMGEQSCQGDHILGVVASDRDEWQRRAATQEVEVASRDLPPVDVLVALDPEQRLLDRSQPGVEHSVPEHPPDER
jgi:hypothetical protein